MTSQSGADRARLGLRSAGWFVTAGELIISLDDDMMGFTEHSGDESDREQAAISSEDMGSPDPDVCVPGGQAAAEFARKAIPIRARLLAQESAELLRGWLVRLIRAMRRSGRP